MNSDFTKNSLLIEEYRNRFNTVLEFINNNFPFGFKRNEKGNSTPRSRFEAISIGVYNALKENPILKERTSEQIKVDSWISGDEFQSIVRSDGANAKSRLQGRIDFVKKKLVDNDKN